MTDADRQIMTIFSGALDRDPGPERAAYLDEACGGDAALRERAEALLRAHEQLGGFLEPRGTDALEPSPAASAEANPMAGTLVGGRYKLIEEIGEGGMGTVWMAQQLEPVKRAVAVKLIKAGMHSKQVLARFEAERQALALMDHPNIAKVLDGGMTGEPGSTGGGRPFFVMELVKGVPITKYCDEHRLTPRQRLDLFAPVCQAVQHAHQKGIIHRDVKPSNILVAQYDGRPVPKVIDFGVAKAAGQQLTDKTLMTGFGAVVGTLEYMSPEQAELNQLDIDTRSDIYSLGVVLYELLTGSTPLDRKRLKQAAFAEVLRIIREEEPPKPSTRLSGSKDSLPSISAQRHTEPAKLTKLVRGELDWIVMKALEKDRNRRYETANGFALDVQRYLADEPVQACPPSAAYRLRKFARRNKVAVALASVVAIALIAVSVAGAFAYRNHLTEQRRLADRKAHEAQLLAEKRQNVLDKALMAAMSGDFDGAEKEIGQAELLGASTGQVRMLRGQVAFHRGDMEVAIQHLEQSARLLPVGEPGAVAARAMLALAYANASQLPRFDALSRELDVLQPISPEDYLFKGHFEATIRPERGLRLLDEAIRRRDSVVGRAARTEARAARALISGKVDDAELAVEDAQVVRGMLPANPLVLARSVFAHLVAAGIYEGQGRPRDVARVLAQARRDVQELEEFSALPFAAKACFEYFDYVDDEEAAYTMSGHGSAFRRAVMLYRRQEFAKALEAAERSRAIGRGFSAEAVERAFILAELPDGPARARAACEAAKAEARSVWQLLPPMILLLLGHKDDARQAYLGVRKEELPPWDGGWLFTYLDYNCGRVTADELVQAAGEARPKLCDAYFQIGLWRLADGDRAAAREYFQKCVATRAFVSWEWPWARAFLARMEKDPAWPPWIPAKK
jgi:serine/threonine protein kinase